MVERADPTAVFGLLDNETRIGILETLWDERGGPLSFSALREAVGVRDSGQFNYHLDQLVDRFVVRGEDGYELTQAGKLINGAIAAGAYTADVSIDPIELPTECQSCGSEQRLTYEDEKVSVACSSCPIEFTFIAPPGVFAGASREEVPDIASRYLRVMLTETFNGFCCICNGPTTPQVTTVDDFGELPSPTATELDEHSTEFPLAQFECQRCSELVTSGLDLALVDHPAVVSFHHDHGIDIRDRPAWSFVKFGPDRARFRDRSPIRAAVTYTLDDESLTLVVDEDLDILEIEGDHARPT